jgi:uncharacterized transporter YbjL
MATYLAIIIATNAILTALYYYAYWLLFGTIIHNNSCIGGVVITIFCGYFLWKNDKEELIYGSAIMVSLSLLIFVSMGIMLN